MTITKPGVILVDWEDESGKAADRSPKLLEDWPPITHFTRRNTSFVLHARHRGQDVELSFDPVRPRDGRYLFTGDREHGRVESVDDLTAERLKAFCPRALVPYPVQFRIVTAAEASGSRRTWFVGLSLDSY